jgi:hypothetical protein
MQSVGTRAKAQADEGRVLSRAVLRAADHLGITAKTLARMIGVSEPIVSRMRRNEFALKRGTKPLELAVLFVRLYRSLDAIARGDDTVVRAWLNNPNGALGGRPVEMVQTIAGLVDVIQYLDARRALV